MKIITIIFIGFLSSLTMQAKEIQLLTEKFAPYQIHKDGKLSGISVDIVREIQKRVGHNGKMKVYPWNRCYNMALKKDGYAVFSTTRSKIRENLFKWVGPIVPYKVVLFKLKSNKTIYKTLDDAKKANKIAVTKNDVAQQYLASKGFTNFYTITNGAYNNIKILKTKKAVLYPAGYFRELNILKVAGLENEVVATQIPPLVESNLSIAFNKNTDNKIITKWQKALDDIKADGTYDKILSKYK